MENPKSAKKETENLTKQIQGIQNPRISEFSRIENSVNCKGLDKESKNRIHAERIENPKSAIKETENLTKTNSRDTESKN